MVDLNRTPEQKKRKIPPLVWIILAILIGWFAIAMFNRGGIDETPEGGTMPQPPQDEAYMPAAPARGDAPASEGGEVVTPDPAASQEP